MTAFVPIEAGQWVLAFHQPYGPYLRPMPEHLEMFAHRGGGWDNHRKEDIFFVLQVQKVMPKTFVAIGAVRLIHEGERLPRSHVIAACQSEAAAIALRDKFFAIGVAASDKIEAEMYRRIEKFAAREEAKAVRKVHVCLPHIFGRDA